MTRKGRRGNRDEGRVSRRGMVVAAAVLLAVGVGAVATRSGGEAGNDRLPIGPATDPPVVDAGTSPVDDAGVAPADGKAEDPGVSEGEPSGPASPERGTSERAASASDPAVAEPAVAEPVEWASPRERSPVEPVSPENRVPKPDAVRGIYVGAWTVGNRSRLNDLIDLAVSTEVNAFVIDVKDVTGEITYASRLPLAGQVGATRTVKIHDIRGTLERLREHGIYPIARIVVFKDPLLAAARPEWSIEREDGTVWEDNKGVPWVDSYNRAVWDYNIELAREAVALGFSEIQWDYVRFPDVPQSYTVEAVYPAQDGRAKTDAIREFMIYARERLADLDVPLTADVFGITTSTHRDIGIGQVWEKLSDVADVLLPMVYPSHYPDGSWHFPNPNAAPYQIVRRAMDDGVERSLLIDNAAGIRPWLQAFSMGEPDYGPRHIRAQIDAVYDAGLTEWILWSPRARYPREAFATAEGEEPWFAGMGETLYEPPEPEPAKEPIGEPVPEGRPRR